MNNCMTVRFNIGIKLNIEFYWKNDTYYGGTIQYWYKTNPGSAQK